MNQVIENFKLLTLWSNKNDILEGVYYLKNFYKLNKICMFLQEKDIEFEVKSAFKGTNFKERANKFDECILDLKSSVGIEWLTEFLLKHSDKYKIERKKNYKDTEIKIKLIN